MKVKPRNAEANLSALLRIDQQEFAHLQTLGNLRGLSIELSETDQGPIVAFVDKNGMTQAISAGLYAQSLLPLIGFVVRTEDESTDSVLSRQEALEIMIKERFGEHVKIPLYTRALLHTVHDSFVQDILQQSLGLERGQRDALFTYFQTLEIKPVIDFYDGWGVLLFEDSHRIMRQINTSAGSCGGFLFPLLANGGEQPTKKTASEINLEYQRITHTDGAQIWPIPTWESLQNLFGLSDSNGHNDIFQNNDLAEKESPTSGDEKRWRFEMKDLTQTFLNSILLSEGLEVVDARDLLQPGHAEAVAQKVFQASLPFPLVDLILVRADQDVTHLEYRAFYGPTRQRTVRNAEDQALTPWDNVCGFIFLPDEATLRQRKDMTRLAKRNLQRFYPGKPEGVIMTLTPSVLTQWIDAGSALVPQSVLKEEIHARSSKYLADYGFSTATHSSQKPEVSVHTYEPENSHIGGTQTTVVVKLDEFISHAIKIDLGWIFDLIPTWSGLGNMPPPVQGIEPFLRMGMFDTTRRLYRLDLIQQSITDQTVTQVFTVDRLQDVEKRDFHSLEEFLIMEVFHRLGEEEFVHFLFSQLPYWAQKLSLHGGDKLSKLINFLKQREKVLYSQKTIFDLMALTHNHQDHNLGIALINQVIPIGLSPITRALALADFKLSSNWMAQDVAAIRQRQEPKVGSSYKVLERPYVLFEPEVRHQIAEGIFVTAFETYHSIPGVLGYLVEVEYQGENIARVFSPGDYRDGRQFEALARKLKGEKIDVVFAEGTNPPSSRKASISLTEADVSQNIDTALQKAAQRQHLVVIDVVKAGFERLTNIIQLAEAHHRSVVISTKILTRLGLIQMALRGELLLPNVQPGNPNVAAWKPNKSVHTLNERDIYREYGTVTVDELEKNPEHFVLIRENEAPPKLNGIGSRVTWIDSTYGPYTEAARNEKRDRKTYAQKSGWTLLTSGFHASGHTPILAADNKDAQKSAVASLALLNAKLIVPYHTERRGEVAKILRAYLPARTKVLDRLSHPRHKIIIR